MLKIASNYIALLCEDERIFFCVKMQHTWFWNVCLQIRYNTKSIVYLQQIKTTFPENTLCM